MDPRLAAALTPAQPGTFVRVMGSIIPGVGRTRDQIVSYAEEWAAEAEAAVAGKMPVFVALGDSLAQGIGASSRAAGYVSLVSDDLRKRRGQDFAVLNLSRSGARLHDVLETQLPALDAANVRLIGGICTVGSNDLVRSGRLGQTRNRFSEVLVALPEEILMATIPDAKSLAAKRMNRYLRAEAQRIDRPLADVAAALTTWRGMVAGDGFHPNDRGHRLWADTVLAALGPQPQGTEPLVTQYVPRR